MAYYVAALPFVYISTQIAATHTVHAVSNWFTTCTALQDDSAPAISTAKAILHLYRDIPDTHHAFSSREHLENALEQLIYTSNTAQHKNNKWRIVRKDFSHTNDALRTLVQRVEQRIRLLDMVVSASSAFPQRS